MKQYFLSRKIKGRKAISDIEVGMNTHYWDNKGPIKHLFLYKGKVGEKRKLETIDKLIEYYSYSVASFLKGNHEIDCRDTLIWLNIQKLTSE